MIIFRWGKKLYCAFSVLYGVLVGMMPLLHGRRLKETEKNQIRNKGLVHFTSKSKANRIVSEKKFKATEGHKAYSNYCRPCVFFFINGEDSKRNKDLNVDHKKNHGVFIINIDEEQISKCKKRYIDSAIIYDGAFHITDNNKVDIIDLENQDKHQKWFTVRDCIFTFLYFCPLIIMAAIIWTFLYRL